jgi:ABC-2 type transport system ATP-binding protein
MNVIETPALEIRGIVKRYRKFVLGEVSLNVPPGSITALLGANGTGKTTLMNLIFGVGAPEAGTIRVFGCDHFDDDVALKRITAFAGPDLDLSYWGTVRGALNFLAAFRPSWDAAYEQQLLEQFALPAQKSIRALSFGEQTKLGLVAALSWRPRLLVLDEPTTGLDVRARQFLMNELLAVVTDPSRSVLLSSHQLTEVERIADRMVVLHGGRVLLEGEVAPLVDDYCWAQWSAPEKSGFEKVPGIWVPQRDGLLWKAMLKRSVCPPEKLEALGATQLHTQPVTLEELFLALTAPASCS